MQLATFFKKVITYSFYLLFFLTPLILTTSNFELFEFPKMLFVYAMTVIIAGAWTSLWIVQKKITIRRTPFDYFFLFFLLTQILSTIFSIHPYTSIFGYYSRFHGGLLSTICYLALFYAFTSTSTPGVDFRLHPGKKNKKSQITNHKSQITNSEAINYQTALFLLFTSASLAALYGTAEHFGIDAAYWIQDVQNRVFSTLGQPNWLAAFLTALIPFTLAFAIKPPRSKYSTAITLLLLNTTIAYSLTHLVSGKTLPTTIPSIIFFLTLFAGGLFLINHFLPKIHKKIEKYEFLNFYLLFTLFVTTVLFTKSRSGILAMVVSFGVFWALVFLKESSLKLLNPKTLKLFLSFSFLLLALSLIVGTEWTPTLAELARFKLQGSSFKAKITNHKSQITSLPKYAPHISKSTDIRKAVWEGAIRVWENYPLTGSGVETFAYSFYNFRPRSHNDLSEWDFLYNKAHNEYLNYLATTGILGTTAVLSIIIVFFYLNLRQVFGKPKAISQKPKANYLLRITYYVLLPLCLISLIYFLKPSIFTTLINKLVIYPPLLKPLGICLGLALVFVILIVKVFYKKNYGLRITDYGLQKVKTQRATTNYQLLTTSYAASMAAILITNFYGFSVVTIGLLSFVFLPVLSLSATINPNHKSQITNHKSQITSSQWLYLFLACLISLICLIQIIDYYRADWLFTKGKNLARANQMIKGIGTLEKATKLRPKEALYHSELGEIYAIASLSLHTQDATSSAQNIKEFTQKASGEAKKTLKLNPVHINFYKSVAKIYLTLAQIEPDFYQKAIETLEKAWRLSPTDPKLPYNLGVIARVLGENEQAETFFEKTVELRPAYRKAWLDLAETRVELDKKDKAAKAYKFILDNIDPEDKLANGLSKELQ